MRSIFPTVETVRRAINEFPPNKLELYKETNVHPQWLYNFMRNRAGAGSPHYPNLVKLIRWLEEKNNVRFVADDQYTTQ